MRKYRNGKKSLRSKGDDKYSEEYLGYRIARGSLSLKTKLVDTDSNGEEDTILKSWRSPSVGKVQEYVSSVTPTPPTETKPSDAPTGIETLLSPIESPVSISTLSSPLFAPESIGVLASPQSVPTGISTLQSPRFQPTDISISTVNFVAPPTTEPTNIDTLVSPQLPPTNIQTELQVIPPTSEPTDIATLASPQGVPTGIATLASPQFEPTNLEIALDNDGDGVYVPEDEDDNDPNVTEPPIIETITASEWDSLRNRNILVGTTNSNFLGIDEYTTSTIELNGVDNFFFRRYAYAQYGDYFAFLHVNDDLTCIGYIAETNSSGERYFTKQADLGTISSSGFSSGIAIDYMTTNQNSSSTASYVYIIAFPQ